MRTGNNHQVGIIGFGRFGKLLTTLLAKKFEVLVYDIHLTSQLSPQTDMLNFKVSSLREICQCATIYIAVPIREFEHTLKALSTEILPEVTLIDVCSVKIYPVKLMLNYLPTTVNIIATHPLFGPDSIHHAESRKMMMHFVRGKPEIFSFWKIFFQDLDIKILEMTPEQHDELAAKSQSITHFIGRTLDDAHFETTGIDTKGFQELLKLKQQTCNDSWDLFFDLQRYNPYSKKYIQQLLQSANNIYQKIIDNE